MLLLGGFDFFMEKTIKTTGNVSRETFTHPFSKRFWQLSASEFKSIKMLVLAAIIIALRVVIKSFKIPIAPPLLYLGFDFMVNSLGSMIYGPIMALAVGAVSDTLGAIIFPIGDYFFPFIIVEMMSGFIFGMFLYRQKLSVWRIILSRLAVVIICNFIINPIIMTWYNKVYYLGAYEFITIARVAKNAAMFPIECVILVFWLGALSSALYSLGYTHFKPKKMEIKAKHIIALVLALLISAAAIIGYVFWKNGADAKKAVKKAFAGNENVTVEAVREKGDDGSTYKCTIISEDGKELVLHYNPTTKVISERSSDILEAVAKETGVDEAELSVSNITFIFAAEGSEKPYGFIYTFSDKDIEKLNISFRQIAFDGFDFYYDG